MKARYVGVVYNYVTKEIIAVVNPDHDSSLDDVSHTSDPIEDRRMLKLSKRKLGLPKTLKPLHIPRIIKTAQALLAKGEDWT